MGVLSKELYPSLGPKFVDNGRAASKFPLPVEKATSTTLFLNPIISALPSPSISPQNLGFTSLLKKNIYIIINFQLT